MSHSDIYLYSPLSKETVAKGQNRALLLQFILSELFHQNQMDKAAESLTITSSIHFFPFSFESKELSRMEEHAQLLKVGFPKLEESVKSFQKALEDDKNPKELYDLLQPFLIACSKCENLIVFLLKHADEIAKLSHPENLSSLLQKMFPDGLEEIVHLIKSNYSSRGLDSRFPEIEKLLSQYES